MPVHAKQSRYSKRPMARSLCSSRRGWQLACVVICFLGVALACSLPARQRSTPTPPTPIPTNTRDQVTVSPPHPTPTPQLFPPFLIESDPLPGSEVGLQGPITLYFNQAMDRTSVETAFSGVKGDFSWLDDASVEFIPARPFTPDSMVRFRLGAAAQAANGLSLNEPVSLTFQAVGYLRLTQRLPEPEARAVNPTSAVVAAFNRPVVALGSDPAGLQPAFTLEPEAAGRGEWLNTSTYAFYPLPALVGGGEYTVHPNPDLTGLDGSPFENVESWSFSTAAPRLVSLFPAAWGQDTRLDEDFILTFNQPMNTDSVAANFSVLAPEDIPIPGELTWNESATVFTFDPIGLLRRGVTYTMIVDEQTQSSGGTPLVSGLRTSLRTVQPLRVVRSDPLPGEGQSVYAGVTIAFNAPIQPDNVLDFITFSPEVPELSAYAEAENERTLQLYGQFIAETDYTLIISPNLSDAWNGRLGQEFTLSFRTLPLEPELIVSLYSDVLFLTSQDASLTAQVTNLSQLMVSLGSVPLADFQAIIPAREYELRQSYRPADQVTFRHPFTVAPNRSQAVDIPLTPGGDPLAPGLYAVKLDGMFEPRLAEQFLLVVSDVHLTFKLSATDALVWAVNLRDNSPVAGAPIVIYAEDGAALAAGQTDSQGIFRAELSRVLEDAYLAGYALLGQPGDELFALALSNWSQGIEGWFFGLITDYTPPHLDVYLYTDRPIYRPGQSVYFRAVARQAFNGRYALPDLSELPLTVYDGEGNQRATLNLRLSSFGTADGSYLLPDDAVPGTYQLSSEKDFNSGITFQVAEYRKPEINLEVSLNSGQVLAGESLLADVNARFFFDAPVGNLPVKWSLYRQPSYFDLPGYQVGKQDDRWLSPLFIGAGNPLGELVSAGEAVTDPAGRVRLEIPTEPANARQMYTLEVTAVEESGLPVSARAQVDVNPSEFYIGVRPDTWVGQAGQELGFEVLVVGWDRQPIGAHALRADFQKVRWERVEPESTDPFAFPLIIPHYTPVSSADFVTGPDGVARLAFTAPEAGAYQLDISLLAGLSGGLTEGQALTQAMIWVGGPGQAVWPDLPNQRVRLTADRASYIPGQTAQIFIPNPFGTRASALVTVERGLILRHQVLEIEGAGATLSLPLNEADAPNVYVSVTVLKPSGDGRPDFRQGYLNLPVEPVAETLRVALTGEPHRTSPGGEVVLRMHVTDHLGNPVEGEFSLSVVDLAALALADPNTEDILPAFYGEQPLGVRTSLALAGYVYRVSFPWEGVGGGGDGGLMPPLDVREEFPDTAYWNAAIVTNGNGEAQVTLNLPDNLTTWQVEARGLTADTRVGQAKAQLVATKDLLVRPITPRFLVAGDHTLLAAMVNNNSSSDLTVNISLQAPGINLDDPLAAQQQVRLPAGDRVRVEWWGTVQQVESVDLVIAAEASDSSTGALYQDASRPAQGALPVLSFVTPQTFGTSGLLEEGGEILELVTLPKWFTSLPGEPPQQAIAGAGGELRVELAPSLAAAMVTALDALERNQCECTEQALSSFLPNLEIYRVLQEFGLEMPGLQARLERALDDGLLRLIASQNEDGGWGWWEAGGESDAYITAYVLFGLSRARQAGIEVDQNVTGRAVGYLYATMPAPDMISATWQFDRLAFIHFALTQAEAGELERVAELYGIRQRLGLWAQALLALSIESLSPGDERIQTLLSDLQSAAQRSATGAYWEAAEPGWQNMSTTLYATAVVLYALAQHDPASPLVADGLRYLMAHRQVSGGWASTYETAWTLLALARIIQATGELGGDFQFAATLNDAPLADGQAGGDAQLTPVTAKVQAEELNPVAPNALVIQRNPGAGRLYYTAHLSLQRPAAEVPPLSQGISVARSYYPVVGGEPEMVAPIHTARAGDLVSVRLTLVIPETAYYLRVEDYIPAGAEVHDISLKTSQQGAMDCDPRLGDCYDPRRPFAQGWGWWYFNSPRIYDDHIAWSAQLLPPGTYELTYTLVILQAGEYRVLPARAWQLYFPEVQGNSAGEIFVIED